MVEAQNKIVSIETFRAAKFETNQKTTADRWTGSIRRGTHPNLSARSVEHRERMLRFLRMEAVARREAMAQPEAKAVEDGREVQGRLLL